MKNLKFFCARKSAALSVVVVLSQILSGCLSDEQKMQRKEQQKIAHAKYLVENAAKYQDTSDRALCMDWMTTYSRNIHQRHRKAEISRRKLDCWEYGNVAAEQRIAKCEFDNALAKLAKRTQINCTTGNTISAPQTVLRIPNNIPRGIDNRCVQDGGTQMCYNRQSQRYGNN